MRWQTIDDLLQAALACAPVERSAFLARECAGDEPLRREVESLILHHGQAGNLLEVSLPRIAAELLGEGRTQLEQGQTIGHYQVIAPLGAGGMGEVYLARDTRLTRKIALKILPPGFATDSARALRLQQEARAASALNHPNIVTIYEIGQSDGIRFMAAEFVDGQTLRRRMAAGKMTLIEALDVTCQVASALCAAHEAGIVHRDIKPENIMLRQDGLVKVLDFGLAKLVEREVHPDPDTPAGIHFRTDPGIIMGTPHYMSPEQARGQKVDARTDIFSFGVVLFEMIAGRLPFVGATANDVIAAILVGEPPSLSHFAPGVPDELDQIVTRTLVKDKAKRYRSTRELLSDLRSLKQELEYRGRTEAAAPGAGRKPASFAVGSERTKYYRRVAAVSLLALMVCVAAFGNLSLADRTRGMVQPPVQAKIPSIVVRSFENFSADPRQEPLADGMTDAVVTELAQIRALRVISRTLARHYGSGSQPLPETARALGADYVVEGTVMRSGKRIRLDAKLIEAATDRYVWAASYDRDLQDVLILQADVARAIAGQIQVKLGPKDQSHLAHRQPVNPEAYIAYLDGQYYFNKRSLEGYNRGLESYKQALEKSPAYAAAHAGVALCYDFLGLGMGSLSPIEAANEAKLAARKSLELDGNLADAHAALAFALHNYDWNWGEAEKEYKRAIELDPHQIFYYVWLATLLRNLGREEEAQAYANQSREIDPLLPLASVRAIAGAHHNLKQYDQGFAVYRRALESEPDSFRLRMDLAGDYLASGHYREAAGEYQTVMRLFGPNAYPLAKLGLTYALSRETAKAESILRRLRNESRAGYPSYASAQIYAALGRKEDALAWLQRAYEERAAQMAGCNRDPVFTPLVSDARFQHLVRHMGLALSEAQH